MTKYKLYEVVKPIYNTIEGNVVKPIKSYPSVLIYTRTTCSPSVIEILL